MTRATYFFYIKDIITTTINYFYTKKIVYYGHRG